MPVALTRTATFDVSLCMLISGLLLMMMGSFHTAAACKQTLPVRPMDCFRYLNVS